MSQLVQVQHREQGAPGGVASLAGVECRTVQYGTVATFMCLAHADSEDVGKKAPSSRVTVQEDESWISSFCERNVKVYLALGSSSILSHSGG
jgi:hypothetical protein